MKETALTAKGKFIVGLPGLSDNRIGFVDVGSGGALKEPWSHIPEAFMSRFSIEPTDAGEGLPLCLSNRTGKSKFYVAHDERGSSLHEPLTAFAERYGQGTILTKKVIDVELATLDQIFADRMAEIDALDINTEGHDYQVLQGGEKMLQAGRLKLIKIEFELTGVWKEQGWFSDIDALCRQYGYDLVQIDIEAAKPVQTRDICHPGEPLWGKAYYAPGAARWNQMLADSTDAVAETMKAVALMTAADVPGRAFDMLDSCSACGADERQRVKGEIKKALRPNILKEVRNDAVRFFKGPLRILKYYFN